VIDILEDDVSLPATVPAAVARELIVPSRGPVRARPYQAEADESVEAGWSMIEEGRTIRTQLVTMATGCGKTPFMGMVARRAYDRGGRVLCLAHTDELIEQARDKFSKLTGLPAAKEKAEDRALLDDRIVVGSVQTLCRQARLDTWPRDHFNLIEVDECHRSLADSYQRVLGHFDSARVVGVTATADRGDKKALGEFYQRLAYDYPMVKAVKDGWLVRPLVQTLPLEIDLRGVKTSATSEGSDLNGQQVGHVLEPFLGEIARAIKQEAGHRKILIFMPSVDTSAKMAAAMREAGFAADFVAGNDKDRSAKIARYQRGELQVLCNAMLLTEGFDCDDIDCVVCLRATKIRALYVQMVGRGTRPLASIVGALGAAESAEERCRIIAQSRKPHVLLLDPLWLYEQHDLTTPASLVTANEELAKQMKGRQGDLIANQEEAERDFLENLRKAIAKNRNRRAATVDPLTFAISIDDKELAAYEPQSLWEMRDPTVEQLRALENEGIETELVKWRGQAERILHKIRERRDRGLCSVRLMNWLKRHGIDATLMTHEEATRKQRGLMMGFKGKGAR